MERSAESLLGRFGEGLAYLKDNTSLLWLELYVQKFSHHCYQRCKHCSHQGLCWNLEIQQQQRRRGKKHKPAKLEVEPYTASEPAVSVTVPHCRGKLSTKIEHIQWIKAELTLINSDWGCLILTKAWLLHHGSYFVEYNVIIETTANDKKINLVISQDYALKWVSSSRNLN